MPGRFQHEFQERRDGPRRILKRKSGGLFLFVDFEQTSCFFEVEEVSVDDEFVFACVGRDLVNALNGVAALAKLLNEKVDVYHGDQYTRGWKRRERERGWVVRTNQTKLAIMPVNVSVAAC
jgi:hypothetical protein